MAVIAISGRKGGIGKTTITGNLAVEMVALGHRVAVLDTDPQRSLVKWASLGKGALNKLAASVPTSDVRRFKNQVQTVSRVADRVLLDTPPGFADPALLAALLADLVILPAGPSPLDILAAREALQITLRAREKRDDGNKPLIRLLPARVTAGTTLGRDLPAALEGLGQPVLPPIHQRVALAECALTGLTVREYANRSPAQREFAALAKAVEEVLGS